VSRLLPPWLLNFDFGDSIFILEQMGIDHRFEPWAKARTTLFDYIEI
jgi:hypothetical protein